MPQYNFSAVSVYIQMLWKLKMHEQKDSLLRTKKLIRNSFQSLISMFSFFSPIIHQDGIKSCSIPLFRLIILTVPSLITPPCRQKEPVKPHSQAFWDINEYCKNCVGPVIIFQDGCNENPTPHSRYWPSIPHAFLTMYGGLFAPTPSKPGWTCGHSRSGVLWLWGWLSASSQHAVL